MRVSVVVPLKNEENSVVQLLNCLRTQSRRPDEIVLVDGGSTDRTLDRISDIVSNDNTIVVIRTNGATPGKGRNLGTNVAKSDWIAFTDGGITMDENWLSELCGAATQNATGTCYDVVFGNYEPVIRNFFEKCAALAYVPPLKPGKIRGRFIASSLLRKLVWERVGGFPDARAAEDLMFMDSVRSAGFRTIESPNAIVHWELRPDVVSTFRKFVLYSKHNVLVGRQWDWHYGILRQYVLLIPLILLAFAHSALWLLVLPLWLGARTAKRAFAHRYEFGFFTLCNPILLVGVGALILLIDFATFAGWAQVKLRTRSTGK